MKILLTIFLAWFGASFDNANVLADDVAPTDVRKPADDGELRFWLENMIWYHRFLRDEIGAATELTAGDIDAVLVRFRITPEGRPRAWRVGR